MENILYYGDNLDIMRRYIKDESVDLIYLDPPFKSGKDYNILFKEANGSDSIAQIKAFEDTWHWDRVAEETFREIIELGPTKVVELLKGIVEFLQRNDMMSYLVMMAPRLLEMRRILKDTGSIYLHCDPTAGHYLKILMDAVFGVDNFRNEIVWCYTGPGQTPNYFPRKHDIVLWYTRSQNYIFNKEKLRVSYKKSSLAGGKTSCVGRKNDEILLELDKRGKIVEDWWSDIATIGYAHKQIMGYPTQKPEALLERIIKASSNEDDLVLDPFCGCGTTISVAQKLGRRWIGIDITHLAISLIKFRLENTFIDVIYKVIGEPVDIAGANKLAQEDRYQFQYWTLGLVSARPAKEEEKKGADRGIDGKRFFQDQHDKSKIHTIIYQVKSGHVNSGMIRDLKSHLNGDIAVFITLNPSTREMKKEALSAGYYTDDYSKTKYERLQILTIEDLLEGKKVDHPFSGLGEDITLKRAERYKEELPTTPPLFEE